MINGPDNNKLHENSDKAQKFYNQRKIFLNRVQKRRFADFKDEWDRLKDQPYAESCRDFKKSLESASSKNRYPNNIPCNDRNRVKLANGTYFHGNFITGSNKQQLCLATQGPMEETVNDFWIVISEQGIDTIIMLCKHFEPKNGVMEEKCYKYYPTSVTSQPVRTPEYIIEASKIEREDDGTVITKLKLMERATGKLVRIVTHVQVTEWPDRGVPNNPRSITKVYQNYYFPCVRKNIPILVHCSAGVGRTGAFIAPLYCYDLFLDNKLVSVEEALVELRKMRAKVVQTPKQYVLVFILLIDLLENCFGGQNVSKLGAIKSKWTAKLRRM